MMARERLPDRRPCINWTFYHRGFAYDATASFYPDGRVGEVFLGSGKAGTDLDIATRDSAIALSIAIQHGAPLDLLKNTFLRNGDGVGAAGVMAALCDELARMLPEQVPA